MGREVLGGAPERRTNGSQKMRRGDFGGEEVLRAGPQGLDKGRLGEFEKRRKGVNEKGEGRDN